jgi:hypothetical protein
VLLSDGLKIFEIPKPKIKIYWKFKVCKEHLMVFMKLLEIENLMNLHFIGVEIQLLRFDF